MTNYIRKTLYIFAPLLIAALSLLFTPFEVMAYGSQMDIKNLSPFEFTNLNEAESQNSLLDDGTVSAKVRAELLKDASVKDLKISVETRKGQVVLIGFVENNQQLQRAAQIVSGIRGVLSIKNGLVIQG